jgi:Spy/CpxP family protein refolding chaperone
MMHSRAYPPERVSLCAIAAALVLSVLLSAPAAGMTQRHCRTKPHIGRHDGGEGRKGKQMLVCGVDVSRQQGQSMRTARRIRDRHGISIELGGSEPVGN